MTPDQIARLQDLQGRLVETVINDADPQNWTASGLLLADMDSQQRGDANWCRKTAVQSVSLLIRVQQLLEPKTPEKPGDDADPEADIKRAERAASDMLKRVGGKVDAAKR
jgi:hypothetical protein